MKQSILLILLCVLCAACSNSNNEENASNVTDSTVVEQSTVASTITEASPDELKRVALSFHQWYINNQEKMVNDVPITQLNLREGKGNMCEFDFESYFSELRKLGTISERFLDKEKERVAPCAAAMKKVSWSDYTEDIIYAYPESCDFFEYRYWTRSNESFSGVEFSNMTKKDNFWLVELKLFVDDEDGSKSYNELYLPVVKIEKENEQYLITEITWKS